jgi:hypothetical protein
VMPARSSSSSRRGEAEAKIRRGITVECTFDS